MTIINNNRLARRFNEFVYSKRAQTSNENIRAGVEQHKSNTTSYVYIYLRYFITYIVSRHKEKCADNSTFVTYETRKIRVRRVCLNH